VSARRNDIFLCPFPFSDFSEEKIRPVVVISSNNYNSNEPDAVVCGITSNGGNPHALPIRKSDMEHGNLYEGSCARADMVGRVSQQMLGHRVGKVREEFRVRLIKKTLEIIG